MYKKIKYTLLAIIAACVISAMPILAMDSVNENAGTAVAWKNGYQGEGMVVAVLDLEFDVNHEVFTLSEATEPRLSKDDITEIVSAGLKCTDQLNKLRKSPYINEKIPFAYDYGEHSTSMSGIGLVHGTHVAGIIGANKNNSKSEDNDSVFNGIVPEVQLILMKISDSAGKINYTAAIEALSDAISLGADVINLSWGEAAGFSNTVEAYDFYGLVQRALNQGIDVVCAAGNTPRVGNMSEYDKLYGILDPLAEYPDYGLASAPSIIDKAISVASFNNDKIKAKGHIETYSGKKIIYSEAYQTFAEILAKPTVKLNYIVIESDGAKRLYKDEAINYKGKLVVMEYTNDIAMMTYLKKQGAVGVIFYSQYENDPFMRTLKSAYIPVVYVSNEDGMTLVNSENYSLTLFEYPSSVEVENPAANDMSNYSAWGTSDTLGIKPDVTAIGGNVYSASPGNLYETMSGTSMSSPVIVGAMAVIKQYMLDNDIENNQYTARQLLTSTAEPLIDLRTGIEYSPRRQGAGLLKLDKAVTSDVLIYNVDTLSAKIELGDNITNEFSMEFTVRNLTDKPLEYDITASIFTDGYYYNETLRKYFAADSSTAMTRAQIFVEDGEVNINSNSRGNVSADKITVPGGSAVTVKLNVIIDKSEHRKLAGIFTNGYYTEGYIYLTPSYEGGVAVSVPYMGFNGNWNTAPIFDDGFYTQSLGSSIQLKIGEINVELGKNIFIDDTVTREMYAFSPDGDGAGDVLMFLSKSLRNYYLLGFYVTNNHGDIVYEGIKEDFRKKAYVTGNEIYFVFDRIWDGKDTANPKYNYPDGLYYLSVVTSIDSKGADAQVYTIPFTIDTKKPTVTNNKIVDYGDGKYELTFDVEDNLGVQLIRILKSADDEMSLIGDTIPFLSASAVKSETITVDITEFVESAGKKGVFYIEVIDYAMNSITYKISLEDYKL
jgi:Subtilisin-like serine proteases